LLNEAVPARERLINYFAVWQQQAESSACHKLCLAVKLAAEVSDLSEAMRLALTAGMQGITQKIAVVLQEVQRDGHISAEVNTAELAEFLYATWVGASLLSKVHLQMRPMEVAMQQTKKILGV
jgi:TetR/AcrR family transcriptional repressor of nem operon